MPAPKGQELGVRDPLSVRVGIDLPKFRGENTQSDPGAIGDDEFQGLQNVTLDGTGIRPRPGLASVFDSAMDDCVDGLFDDRNPSAAFMLLSGGLRVVVTPVVAVPVPSPAIDFTNRIAAFKPDMTSPQLAILEDPAAAGSGYVAGPGGTGARQLFFEYGDILLLCKPGTGEFFEVAFAVNNGVGELGFVSETPVFTLPAGYYPQNGAELAGILYIAVRRTTPASACVYSWDGTDLTLEITETNYGSPTTTSAVVCMPSVVVLVDELYFFYSKSNDAIVTIVAKALDGGAWTALAIDASANKAVPTGKPVVLDGDIYVPCGYGATGNARVLTCDGTTVTLGTATLGGTNSYVNGSCIHGDEAYFTRHRQDESGGVVVTLFKWDGVVWTDVYIFCDVDGPDQDGNWPYILNVPVLASRYGLIFAGGDDGYLYESDADVTEFNRATGAVQVFVNYAISPPSRGIWDIYAGTLS